MRREFGMFVALVLMCLAIWYSNPLFLSESNVVNTTRQIAMLGIFAIGSAFVIITGGIDLSVGSIVGLTGVIVAKMSSPAQGGLGMNIWLGVAVALAVASLIGLIQGLLITRLQLQPFIVTLAFMLILRGVSQVLVDGGVLGFGTLPFRRLARTGFISIDSLTVVTWPVIIFLIVIVLAGYLLHFTVFGRYVYAVGGNRAAAEYSGIRVARIETTTYVISAGLAGLAGVCYAAQIGEMSQNVGLAYEVYAIAAAVLGGCSLRGGEGSVVGVVIGSGVMEVIHNGLNLFRVATSDNPLKRALISVFHGIGLLKESGNGYALNDNWQNIVIGGTILIAVVLDQVVHIVESRRRTRRSATAPKDAAPAAPSVVATPETSSQTPRA